MVRMTPTVLAGTLLVCAFSGCASMVEMETITRFDQALQTGDVDKLKASASTSFDEKAMRRDEDSIKALKVLDLHTEEKFTVVKVVDVSDKKKKVLVSTARTHRKMQYNLVRDEKTGKWVVDDIILKQRTKDVEATKRVTEQMDLLLAVQDFLVNWHTGKREKVTAVVTPTFAKLLSQLPPTMLARITKKVAGDQLRPAEFRPKAMIDGNDAVVRMDRIKGVLILTMKQTTKGWKVSDAAVESRKDKDHLASARKMATVLRTVADFLVAYRKDDKRSLKTLAAPKLYDNCLALADLKMIELPTPEKLSDKDAVKTHPKGGEYVIQRANDTIKISLIVPPDENGDLTAAKTAGDESNDPAKYVIDDVTIYDSKQEMRLSAMYTAQAKMRRFVDAMIKGNIALVRENSTKDLSAKVWSKLGPLNLAQVLPPEIELELPVITDPPEYHGSVIRFHVKQGSRDLTYVMLDWSGDVTVDDVLMPVMPERTNSLKQTMQSLLPIRLFAAALLDAPDAPEARQTQLDVLRATTSRNFNRVVWSQVKQVPEATFAVLPNLDASLTSITDTPAGQTVQFGDERFGAKIELIREKELLVIDRLWVYGGAKVAHYELKNSLQFQMARRGPKGLNHDPMSTNPISTDPPQTAEAALPDSPRTSDKRVTPAAGFEDPQSSKETPGLRSIPTLPQTADTP
jgi:hypothetical protein